jgi:hypothetical protein
MAESVEEGKKRMDEAPFYLRHGIELTQANGCK